VTFEEHLSGVIVSAIITGVTITDQVGERVRIRPKVGKKHNQNHAFTDFVDVLSHVTDIATDLGFQR